VGRTFPEVIQVGAQRGDFVDLLEDGPDDDKKPDRTAIPWLVLIADDDRNVHDTTLLALRDARVGGRPLQFLHAYSAAEARAAFTSNRDIAVVLLDVVMETDNAGLQLVTAIRDELGRRDVKIIIRTGQPGYASESYVTRNFDVDGYLTKAKLTRAMLLDAIGSALGARDVSDGTAPQQ
jgi:CheY-like chemotaxis protein